MPTPIRYPDVVGFRASYNSAIVKIDRQEVQGWKELKASRKRNRTVVRGPNADPLGKTRGSNEYEASIVIYVAEFKAFILDHFGPGYGDIQFTMEITITENGYDTQTHYLRGCTIDQTELSLSEGNEPITMSLDLAPTKILFNGLDDNRRPLSGATAIG